MAEKEFESEDPFEMVGIPLPVHDPDSYYRQMAETFIEEYMMMGWEDGAILKLFQDPFYQAPYLVYRQMGEEFVKKMLSEVRNG